jgi:hypothetical protein
MTVPLLDITLIAYELPDEAIPVGSVPRKLPMMVRLVVPF